MLRGAMTKPAAAAVLTLSFLLAVASAEALPDCTGSDLRGLTLSDGDLSDTSYFWGADLRGALLTHADLRGAQLNGADLRGALLVSVDLRGASLLGADLRGRCWRVSTSTRAAGTRPPRPRSANWAPGARGIPRRTP